MSGGRTMGALKELTTLVAENAELTTRKVAVLASLCPPSGFLKQSSGRVTGRHLHGILAIAQFLAQANDGGGQQQHREQLLGIILEFLRAIPTLTFWPSSFSSQAAKSYFPEFLAHLMRISSVDSGASLDLSCAVVDVVHRVSAGGLGGVEALLASYPGVKAFFSALRDNCPFLHLQDAEQVIVCLLEHWVPSPSPGAPNGGAISSAETSGHASPLIRTPFMNGNRNSEKGNLERLNSAEKGKLERLNSTEKGKLERLNSAEKGKLERLNSAEKGKLERLNSAEKGKLEILNSAFLSPYSTTSNTPDFSPFSTPHKGSGDQTPLPRSGPFSGPIDEDGIFDQLHIPLSHGAYEGTPKFRAHQVRLETESYSALERQEIAYRLLARILDKADVGCTAKSLHVQQLLVHGINQLRTLLPLLKIRKRDWPTDVTDIKIKISKMLQVSQAVTLLQMQCLRWLETDAKLLKIALRESLPLWMDIADACNSSPWRKSKACEDLFHNLITGVAQVVAVHKSQMQRVLLRFKSLVLTACSQANSWATTLGPVFESIMKGVCILIEAGWKSDHGVVESFLLGLAAIVREKDKGHKSNLQIFTMVQLNVISFLADLSTSIDKPEVVELVLPIFIECLEEGEASSPSLLRLKLIEAAGRMACLGTEKSYREVVVLLTRSYLDRLSLVGSTHSRTVPPEGTTERLETLPGAFLQIAHGLRKATLRMDYRHRLLALCSDVGLVAEGKSGRIGADLLGPLLPPVAEVCMDVDPTKEVEPSLLKLYRNLWFYIALFGLAPPLPKVPSKSGNQGGILSHISSGLSQAINVGLISGLSSGLSTGSMPLRASAGPYAWNPQWAVAAEKISQGTPPLVVGSVKWLEDELELNALHNPGSQRGSGNEKVAAAQRAALSSAIGARVDTSSMSTISGVMATYLLAVAFMEVLRFKYCGGVIKCGSLDRESTSALSFVFKYLETPNLSPSIHQCLVAIVHQAFSAAMSWLADNGTATGAEAEQRDIVIITHACFLIRTGSHREENIREIAATLLTQMKNMFPQVLWNPSCLNDLLSLVSDGSPTTQNVDNGAIPLRSISHHNIYEWISQALLLVPCTMQGLLQEQLRRLNRWQSATSDLLSVLSEIRIEGMKINDNFVMASIPAVTAAAAASAGVDPKLAFSGSMEVLSIGIISANTKSNYSGEIAGMKRLYVGMGGLSINTPSFMQSGMGARRRMSFNESEEKDEHQKSPNQQDLGLNEMLTVKFVQQLQQYVLAAERGATIDLVAFREACLRSAALLLSDMGQFKEIGGASSDLLRLLCWCPAHIFIPEAMETGLFVWIWILSAAPQLGSRLLAELVDAWLWTVDTKKGLFASGISKSGPAAKLRPQLTPGEPESAPSQDPVIGIYAHRVWLGFFLDRYEAIRHSSSDQLLLISRLLQGSLDKPCSSHPAATGTFFTLMVFGLKFTECHNQCSPFYGKGGGYLLEHSVYRTALSWFSVAPGWFDSNVDGIAQAEANSVARFLQHLLLNHTDSTMKESVNKRSHDIGLLSVNSSDQLEGASSFLKVKHDRGAHKRRKQLLLMLCQSEADRLETWANPLKECVPRWRVGVDLWAEYVKTAWALDPRIALALVPRFPGVNIIRAEVSLMVQRHIPDLHDIPEALPYIVTPKAVDEDSPVLQNLPYWAPCSITRALDFLTPAYKGHERVLAYVLRVLETYPPEGVTFFMPQLVQSLRYDQAGLVEGYLMVAAQQSTLFAHMLIWQLQGEEPPSSEDSEGEESAATTKGNNLYDIAPRVKQRIIDSFTPEAYDLFVQEFRFFDKVTSISGALYPLPKDERRAGIRRELEKIEVEGDKLYLPTAPNKLVRGIKLDSGIPLQSAAKVPIMITFEVVDKDGDPYEIKNQACIFKVGDDCRQDVLALQVIALLRDIFEVVGINLYLFPYGVLPTGYGRGIIEVVPDARSRNQMGEVTDGGLYEIFQQEYGPVGSLKFERARDNFIVSSAGYAVASLLLQPKDRHNGNLLFDRDGRLVHIDFGFILETSPGGNMRFESAQFKLSHEMTQLLDPSGSMKSEQWHRFVRLCVKGYLAAREHMDSIISTVLLMVDSGLPCFSRGDPIGNLRKRLHPELSEREAANFMIKTCNDAYNKWTTAGYDLIQYLQQGIEM